MMSIEIHHSDAYHDDIIVLSNDCVIIFYDRPRLLGGGGADLLQRGGLQAAALRLPGNARQPTLHRDHQVQCRLL